MLKCKCALVIKTTWKATPYCIFTSNILKKKKEKYEGETGVAVTEKLSLHYKGGGESQRHITSAK